MNDVETGRVSSDGRQRLYEVNALAGIIFRQELLLRAADAWPAILLENWGASEVLEPGSVWQIGYAARWRYQFGRSTARSRLRARNARAITAGGAGRRWFSGRSAAAGLQTRRAEAAQRSPRSDRGPYAWTRIRSPRTPRTHPRAPASFVM